MANVVLALVAWTVTGVAGLMGAVYAARKISTHLRPRLRVTVEHQIPRTFGRPSEVRPITHDVDNVDTFERFEFGGGVHIVYRDGSVGTIRGRVTDVRWVR